MINDVVVGFLAGGLARRLGGIDKCLIEIADKPILNWQLEKTAHFPNRILNANGEIERFSKFNLTIIPDVIDGYFGPLCGVLSMMQYTRKHIPFAKWLLSCATDAPFIPDDLGERLYSKSLASNADIVMASSNGRHHPVFCLWNIELADALEEAILKQEIRKIDLFTARYKTVYEDFSANPDPFLNINTQQDIDYAHKIVKSTNQA